MYGDITAVMYGVNDVLCFFEMNYHDLFYPWSNCALVSVNIDSVTLLRNFVGCILKPYSVY